MKSTKKTNKTQKISVDQSAERSTLIKCFDAVDENKRALALDTIDEYLYFKAEVIKLRALPLIRIDKSNPERQQTTPAGKLIKDYSQIIDAKRATLLRILWREDTSDTDELLAVLKQFEK